MLPLGYLSATSRLPLGYLSATSRLTLGSCRRTEVVPDTLLVAEARPAVRRGLGEEGVVGAPYVDGGVAAAAAAVAVGGGETVVGQGGSRLEERQRAACQTPSRKRWSRPLPPRKRR